MSRQWLVGLGLLGVLAIRPALALPPPKNFDEDLRAERDLLIGKIARAEELDKSVDRFAALARERQQRLGSMLDQQADEKARAEDLKAEKRGLDYSVGESCELIADPANPPTRSRSFMHADWGRVIDKQTIRIPSAHPFGEDEQEVLYKVQSAQRIYTISGKGPHLWYEKPLGPDVSKGTLLLICIVTFHSEGSGSKYPPEFRENILSQGFAAPIKEPPLISKKRQNPHHFPGRHEPFSHAIRTGKWSDPEGQSILSHVLIKEDLGVFGGVRRYSVFTHDQSETYFLEVPVRLKNIELLKPYRYAWVIMGQLRFDRELKHLVLVAEDIEARYVTPAG